jgi:two-component sensor histidine kinase
VSHDERLVSITGVSEADLKGHPSLGGLPQPELLKSVVAGEYRYFISGGTDGVSRIYYASPLAGTRLLTLVGLPQALLLGSAHSDLMRAMIIPLAMMLWALLVAAFAGHFMVARGLRSLSKTAHALRRGNYAARPQLTHGPLELVQLSDTLSELAKRVEQHEQSLSRTIEQKDAMLREIHHRIKNNLQVVTSLMSLQAGRLRDPASKTALADLQRRVRSLSLLHRHLYEGDDLRYLDFGQFVTELCQMVKESGGPAVQDVAIDVDIPPVPVSPDRAVPVALLITEALSNALRHAYPRGGRGRVRIGLTADADAMAMVSIVDDGVGWAARLADGAVVNEQSVGIGLSLMQVFARQLGSELEVQGPPGTTIRFSFALV